MEREQERVKQRKREINGTERKKREREENEQ